MSRLALYLLGPPRLERGPSGGEGVPLELQYHKNLALLAYLAVTGETHTRESLITLLWPELEPNRARANLRRNLSLLRKALDGEWLVVDREMIGLGPDADVWVDIDQFRRLLQVCKAHNHPAAIVCPDCLAALTEAVALYRGDFLEGFGLPDSAAFDEFQFFQTEGLRRELASVLQRLVRGHSSQGEYEPAITYARRWLALDPMHELAHRHLMVLYAQAGQRSAALRQYDECVHILEEELNLSPSQETTALYERIRVGPADGERRFVAPRPRHNLPAQSTPFVGRERELAAIEALLNDPDCRLLTLVGSGGSGKTRLALEVAARTLRTVESTAQPSPDSLFEDGVYFVSLASLRSIEAIVPTVAEAVGFSFYGSGDPRQQLLSYLRHKRILIIMDNYEHLLTSPEPGRGDGVELVSDVLKTAPGVKVLATSRAGLKVQGENRFHVAGLDLPEPMSSASGKAPLDLGEYSAIKLFVQSARRTRCGFAWQADDLAHVACACRLVEGMPLSILLAAAWVNVLTPEEIAAEIGRGLDFLETDLRDAPERQRSVRAVFDHSWKLLTEREREVFQRLSVFRSGFTREAARAVTGASLRELRALVDKSLLHRASSGWYGVHELLRQYAEEKLDQSPTAGEAVRDRHCAYYAAALQQWEQDLKGPQQQAALAEMDVEIENARAAWDWAVAQGQVKRLDQATEGLHEFYNWHWRIQEGEAAFRTAGEKLAAAASAEEPAPSGAEGSAAACPELNRREGLRVLAKILAKQARYSTNLGCTELAGQLLRRSLSILEGPELAGQDIRAEKAYILRWMGQAASDREEARRLGEQSLALYRALGDRWWATLQLVELGWVAFPLGTYGEGTRLWEESLAIGRALGDQRVISMALTGLGVIAVHLGRFEEAERLLRENLMVSREIGSPAGNGSISKGCHHLSFALLCLGTLAEADSLGEEGLAVVNGLGDPPPGNVWHSYTEIHLGQYEQARARAQMDLDFFQKAGRRRVVGCSLFVQGQAALAEEAQAEARQLLRESVAVFRAAGGPMDLGQALAVLGYAAHGSGQLSQARQHLREAMQIAAEVGIFMPRILALPGIALLLADQGEVERAVEIYALASRYPFVANSRWFEDVAGKQIGAAAAMLPSEVVAAAQERGRARDLDVTVAELLVELEG